MLDIGARVGAPVGRWAITTALVRRRARFAEADSTRRVLPRLVELDRGARFPCSAEICCGRRSHGPLRQNAAGGHMFGGDRSRHRGHSHVYRREADVGLPTPIRGANDGGAVPPMRPLTQVGAAARRRTPRGRVHVNERVFLETRPRGVVSGEHWRGTVRSLGWRHTTTPGGAADSLR